MADRKRQPAGVTVGGQFTTEPRTESGVSPAASNGLRELADTMRSEHVQRWHSPSDEAWGRQGFCGQDGAAWPCDVARLLDAIDEAAAAHTTA